MTPTALENKKIESQKEIAEKDRKARELVESRKDATNRQHNAQQQKRWGHQTNTDYIKAISDAVGTGNSMAKDVGATIAALAAAFNSPQWYLSVDGIKEKVGNLPTFFPVGRDLEDVFNTIFDNGGGVLTHNRNKAPAVLTYYYFNTLGDPTKLAKHNVANTMFAWLQTVLRRQNSVFQSYQPGDLGQVLIAAVDLYVRCALGIKAIAAAQTVDSSRINIAKAVLASMGIGNGSGDFSVAGMDLASFKEELTRIQNRIQEAIPIPVPWNYLERKVFLASYIYSDSEESTSQIFHLVPRYYLSYKEEDGMVYQKVLDWTTFLVDLENDFNELNYSQFAQRIFSDIRANYKNFAKLPNFVTDISMMFKPVPEVLHQLMNITMPTYLACSTTTATSVSGPIGGTQLGNGDNFFNSLVYKKFYPVLDSLHFRQNTDGLVYQGVSEGDGPYFDTGILASRVTGMPGSFIPQAYIGANKDFLNFYSEDLPIETTMVASRLHTIFGQKPRTIDSASHQTVYVGACGTEVIMAAAVYVCAHGNTKCDLVTNGLICTPDATQNTNWPGGDAGNKAVMQRSALYCSSRLHNFDWLCPIYKSFVDGYVDSNNNVRYCLPPVNQSEQSGRLVYSMEMDISKLIEFNSNICSIFHEYANQSLMTLGAQTSSYSHNR